MSTDTTTPRSGQHTAASGGAVRHPATRPAGENIQQVLIYLRDVAATDVKEARALQERAMDIVVGIKNSPSAKLDKRAKAAFARRQRRLLMRAVAANEEAARCVRAAERDIVSTLATTEESTKTRGGIKF